MPQKAEGSADTSTMDDVLQNHQFLLPKSEIAQNWKKCLCNYITKTCYCNKL